MLKGNHHALRAAEVAVAGNHSLGIIGPPSSGKTTLKMLMDDLSKLLEKNEPLAIEFLPCWCGYFSEPEQECTCNMSLEEVKNFRRKMLTYHLDMWVTLRYPSFEELMDHRPSESSHIVERIKEANFAKRELSLEANKILKTAYTQLRLNPAQTKSIIRVAGTISALLNDQKTISAPAMAEAISYTLK